MEMEDGGGQMVCVLGPVSQKSWKLVGPVKLILVHLYLKTEKCMQLKLLV